ncbi:MAG TPA: response regulator [Desulfuromonadaceae bacterium]
MTAETARHANLFGDAAHDAGEQRRVLIVDDEAAILFAYRRLIEGGGYVVDACGTLVEAVEHIMSHPYFAVITDLRLTGNDADGLAVLTYVRTRQPGARVIVVTGYDGEESARAAFALEVSFYFRKPLEPSVILEALRHLREDEKTGNRRAA